MALRWGFIGAGSISHDFYTSMQNLPKSDHQVVAIAARNLKNAQQFAKDHNIPKAYEGYEALAKDKDIDVAYIGVIHPYHLDVAKLMLSHGKHVLCEKPLTLNEKQTRELLEFAQKKNLFLMEAIWSRTQPAYDDLKRIIEAGELGEVLFVNVNFGQSLDHVDRLTDKKLGGSVILDLGIYVLQFAQFVFRGLKPIDIKVGGHLNSAGTDESASVILTYPGGKIATLTCHARLFLNNEAVVSGTKGTATLPYFWAPTELITPSKTYTYDYPKADVKYNCINSGLLYHEAEHVRLCIKQGLTQSPKLTHAETLELAQQMDLMRKALGNIFDVDK